MMNMSRFLCVGVSAAALLYCGDVWASEIYGTSVPSGYQAYNLNESGLNAGMMLSLPQKGAKQVASVCFITDAGNCGGAGGGTDSSSSGGAGPIDPDDAERCRLEGYTNEVCGPNQDIGSKCPYDSNWHSGCTCGSEYNKTCTGTNEQGKGEACDGKYTECCNPCAGYDYTESNIPAGYIKSGSCNSCDGIKYKAKCDTNSSNTGNYIDCGTATGEGSSCTDDTGTYYTECTCPMNYEWSASAKECVCSTGYKYTCTGSNDAGGEGASCDNKYQKCKCASGFNWDAASGMCVCDGTDWCALNQDCASLGYKQQSCPEMAIKCPFDTNYVYCISCPSKYKYTCSGTGYSGGSGTACGGKYAECTCASPYTWTNGACSCPTTYKYACSGTGYAGGTGSACGGKYTQCKCASGYKWDATSGTCKADRAVCAVGTLYYSDNTCSADYDSSKTLLGIVIYSNGASGGGWVMAHKPVKTGIYWSTEKVDISGLTNITSESKLTDIQASCTNTDVITAYGSSSAYPAAWAAKNYTEGGKTWCLPSGGLLKNALDNSANFTKFNAAVYKIQASAGTSAATILGKVAGSSEYVWSSSEYNYYTAWEFSANTSGLFGMYTSHKGATSYYSVRPVLAF